MLSFFYVQKCLDLQTEKLVPLRNIDKLFNPNLETFQVLYHSRLDWI